jgi:hypothetical protein
MKNPLVSDGGAGKDYGSFAWVLGTEVRGHQDGTCDFDLLSRPAQLNVIADHVATDALMDHKSLKIALSRTNTLSTNSVRTSSSATIRPITSMISSATCRL